MPSRTLRIAVVVAFVALGVSACGIRGPLELPPEAKAQSDAAKAKKTDTAAKADPNQPKPPPPHRPFFLDWLIQ